MNSEIDNGSDKRTQLSWLFIPLAAVALMLGVWSAYHALGRLPEIPAQFTKSATVIPSPRHLKPFSLTDQEGKTFSPDQLQGHWTFMAFGYTSCPDVCPTTLAVMSQTAHLVDSQGNGKPRFVFVSVDPERDSIARLGEYVRYFNPEFMGVTGADTDLQPLTSQLGILYRKVENTGTALDYLVDHSASIMLIDPQSRLHAVFSAPHDAQVMADDFQIIQKNYNL